MKTKYANTLTDQINNQKTHVIEFFDPPMCCPTGLCGPVLDQTLLDINEMILAFQNLGFTVKRYQMTSDPNAFLSNETVMQLVRQKQMSALPITFVDGTLIKTSSYPTKKEIELALNGKKTP